MEELKSSVRPYRVNDHYKQSLAGPPTYYRISLDSGYIADGSTISDALFDVSHVFPNQRAQLVNGEWHVFLESFEAKMESQIAKTNIKVCLPDLIKSSHDYVMTARGVCQTNDSIGHVPISQEYHAPGYTDGSDVPVDTLAVKPIALTKVIDLSSVGVKVDPVGLFSGRLRVLLRDESHVPVVAGTGAGELNGATEGWRATLLFVHKPA